MACRRLSAWRWRWRCCGQSRRRVSAEPHAIGLGLLNSLRALAARETVLVAIDDVQWLDRPSADALAFVVRRLERESVGFLLARRPGRRPALERVLERTEFERLEIGPLRLGATRQLLSERLGLSLSRYLLRRIVESTLGNPLFVAGVWAHTRRAGVARDRRVRSRCRTASRRCWARAWRACRTACAGCCSPCR